MKTKLTFLLSLTFLFLFACSEQKPNPKIKQIENTKVKESFENHIISIIKSFDIEKLKLWGFSIPINSKTENIEKTSIQLFPHKQTKTQIELGYMSGMVKLKGSLKQVNSWKPRTILLEFIKLSHDDPWKLFIDHEDIEDAHYKDTLDAMANWPEKQTSIGIKMINKRLEMRILAFYHVHKLPNGYKKLFNSKETR